VALLDIRQRSGFLFLAVMVGHVILISAQITSRSGVPVLEAVTFGIFSEVQRGTAAVLTGMHRVWSGYIGLRGVRGENEELRRQLADAQVQVQLQRSLADQTRSLQRLLDLRDRANLQTTAAEVIAAGATPDFRTVTIDKGLSDGLTRDMAVIAPAGIVGRVVMPGPRAAKVQLLVDRNAAAGAIVERSRAQGIVVGVDGGLQMNYVAGTADVRVGDAVVSSGIDGIYPKGFSIGIVESVVAGPDSFNRITLRPAVDFSSLEHVLVVLSATPLKSAEQEPR
jgi:rod shape-determining protein MreC